MGQCMHGERWGGGGGCIVCMCAWGDIHVCMRQCVCIEMGEGGRMHVCM